MNTKELQAIVNPIYITAKGLLNLLIAGGDPDALKLVPHMIPEDLKKKVEKRPPPEMVTCFKIGHMARSDIFNTVALKCGKQTVIDLPSGYSTRCFKVADNGQKYFGFDLPIVIDEIKDITSKVVTEKQKDLISFNAVDATNYDSMRKVLKDVKGEICIITEGLLPYLNESELISMCQAIHKLLSEFGGCWITADGGGNFSIYPLTFEAMFQGDKAKMGAMIKGYMNFFSNVQSFKNSFSANNFEGAKEFLEKQGFIIKEESVANYMNKLKCVPEDKEEALKESLSKIKIWTMTIDKKDDIKINEEKQIFNLECNLIDGIFNVKIEGRLDTLTAPELLKKYKETEGIKSIKVDANKMSFISSAGIRVLKMMIKELESKDKFEIIGANEDIQEMLKKLD